MLPSVALRIALSLPNSRSSFGASAFKIEVILSRARRRALIRRRTNEQGDGLADRRRLTFARFAPQCYRRARNPASRPRPLLRRTRRRRAKGGTYALHSLDAVNLEILFI